METIVLYKSTTSVALQKHLNRYLSSYHCLLVTKKGNCLLQTGEFSISFGGKEMIHLPATTKIESSEMSDSCYIIFYLPMLYCSSLLVESKKNKKKVERFELKRKEYSIVISLVSLTFKTFRTSPARKLEMFYILCNFILEKKTASGNRRDVLFRKFCELVAQSCQKEHGVQYYADCLFITRGYLEKIVKYKAGITPKAFVQRLVINKAVRLLCDSNGTVENIAEELGFHEASAFSTFFKRFTGCSPSVFRQGDLK